MRPGDLVVCVNAGVIPGAANGDIDRLTQGDVYTVEDVVGYRDRYYGVRITEVPLFGADWWYAARFRPCPKTDIGCFKEFTKETELEKIHG